MAKDIKKKKKARVFKKKECQFCKAPSIVIDYKDVNLLKRYINEKGKILTRRSSGACAKHQRQIANAIKNARILALLPFVNR